MCFAPAWLVADNWGAVRSRQPWYCGFVARVRAPMARWIPECVHARNVDPAMRTG
jgi:hypothetical protein